MKANTVRIAVATLVATALLLFGRYTPGERKDYPVQVVVKNDTFGVTKLTLDDVGNYMYIMYPISGSDSVKIISQTGNRVGKTQRTIVTIK